MKKVGFYCQHLLGIGHLTRSLAICSHLVNDFEVHFFQGGPRTDKTIVHSNFHHHFLSPLFMDEETSALFDPEGQLTLDEKWEKRKVEINFILKEEKLDALVVELFPFGRKKFKDEIFQMIEQARSHNSEIKTFSSIRDIMVEKHDAYKRNPRIVKWFLEYFDIGLVHSDQRYLKLDETFPETTHIAHRLHYTGFVTEPVKQMNVERKKQVLISMGGGIVGDEMVLAVCKVAHQFPEYQFKYILGPNSSLGLKNSLVDLEKQVKNLSSLPFGPNFEENLLESELSISLSGYNTMMNVLNTKTKAIVYPYMKNREQSLRASVFEKSGHVRVIHEADLSDERLMFLINDSLMSPYPHLDVNLNGSQSSSLKIREALS